MRQPKNKLTEDQKNRIKSIINEAMVVDIDKMAFNMIKATMEHANPTVRAELIKTIANAISPVLKKYGYIVQ